MGWTVLYRSNSPKNYAEEKKIIRDLFQPADKLEVVQMSKKGSVWYVAVRNLVMEDKPVSAVVIKTSTQNGEFGYKDMDETMHPYYYDAPISLINKLTPTDNENANEWRNNVRQKHEAAKTLNKKVRLENGMVIDVSKLKLKYNELYIDEFRIHDIEKRMFVWTKYGLMFKLTKKQVDSIKKIVLEQKEQVSN